MQRGLIGWFTMIPNATSFVFLNVAGNVADRLIRAGMPVGRVRKLMQTIGFGGIAATLSVVGGAGEPGSGCETKESGAPAS